MVEQLQTEVSNKPIGKNPPAIGLIVLLIVLIAGLSKLSINADPAHLVASGSERYSAYQHLLSRFPGEQHQVFIFTEADALDAKHLVLYQALQAPLAELPSVRNVSSLFSAPTLERALQRIINDPVQAQNSGLTDDVSALLQRPDFLPARFVSRYEDALVMSVMLKPSADAGQALFDINALLTNHYAPEHGISWLLAGTPVVEAALASDVMAEMLRVLLLSVVLGSLVAAWMLRNVRLLLMSLLVPTTSVIATLGAMGWAGLPLTLLTQTVLVVVFLVVFADTLHALRGNRSKRSLLMVCGLTSITTAAAALSLLFAHSTVIQEFGMTLLLGIAVGFAVWCLWLYSGLTIQSEKSAQSFSKPWALPQNANAKRLQVSMLVIFVALLVPTAWLETGFSWHENLPASQSAGQALQLAENRFSGYLPLQIIVNERTRAENPEAFLNAVTEFQTAINADQRFADAGVHRWYSIVDVAALAPGFNALQRVNAIPRAVSQALWYPSSQGNFPRQAVLFAPVPMPMLMAADAQVLNELDARLYEHGDAAQISVSTVTGLPALVKEGSVGLVNEAWQSLFITLLVLMCVVAIALRSLRLGLIAAIPVGFAVATYAAALVVIGEPLRHSGVVLLTLVVGLSVDYSLHLIISARSGSIRSDPSDGSQNMGFAVRNLEECLPVLWVSAMVSVVGFSALLFSDIPSLSILGWTTAMAVAAGFAASVLCLPTFLVKPASVTR